jgi:3-methyladenine DNA glycosylase AlkC
MERVEFIKPTLKRSIHHPELLTILREACHDPTAPFIL